jgi:hypothetical protein
MREMVRQTWLPTLLFALPIFVFELIHGGEPSPPVGTMTLISIIVVPPTWWRMAVARGPVSPGRGTVAGMLCGVLIVLLPAIPITIVEFLKSPPSRAGLGGFGAILWFVVVGIALLLLTPLGAAIGALTALLQKRVLAEPRSPGKVLPAGRDWSA